MTLSDARLINLLNDKLVEMTSSNEINYQAYEKISLLLYWALEMKSKKFPDPPGAFNENRERSNFYTDSILKGDETSILLKRFVTSIIANPARLQLERLSFIKSRIWNIKSSQSERKIIQKIMRNYETIEMKIIEIIDLIDQYDECLNQDDLEKLLSELDDD